MNDNFQNDYVEWTPENMLEVHLNEPDDFLKVKETLSRIGVASNRDGNTLFQSCHILHKQGRYFILHFKELFMLDGKPADFTLDDLRRRNTISILLSDWGLIRLAQRDQITETTDLKKIKIISFKEKSNWVLKEKYTIGNVKKQYK
jgi:hypothetical protein|tara:strand:- start:965 stop:1402 length:438 start_codon:yes stop_codon:yes gene_type:complete